MKPTKLLLALAIALAAGTTGAHAATALPWQASEGIPSDAVSAASEAVLWNEAEKARLERQGFPQYDD